MDAELHALLEGAGIAKEVMMPMKDYIAEHKHLVKLLSKSDDPAIRKEAKDQAMEVKKKLGVKIGKGTRQSRPLRSRPPRIYSHPDVIDYQRRGIAREMERERERGQTNPMRTFVLTRFSLVPVNNIPELAHFRYLYIRNPHIEDPVLVDMGDNVQLELLSQLESATGDEMIYNIYHQLENQESDVINSFRMIQDSITPGEDPEAIAVQERDPSHAEDPTEGSGRKKKLKAGKMKQPKIKEVNESEYIFTRDEINAMETYINQIRENSDEDLLQELRLLDDRRIFLLNEIAPELYERAYNYQVNLRRAEQRQQRRERSNAITNDENEEQVHRPQQRRGLRRHDADMEEQAPAPQRQQRRGLRRYDADMEGQGKRKLDDIDELVKLAEKAEKDKETDELVKLAEKAEKDKKRNLFGKVMSIEPIRKNISTMKKDMEKAMEEAKKKKKKEKEKKEKEKEEDREYMQKIFDQYNATPMYDDEDYRNYDQSVYEDDVYYGYGKKLKGGAMSRELYEFFREAYDKAAMGLKSSPPSERVVDGADAIFNTFEELYERGDDVQPEITKEFVDLLYQRNPHIFSERAIREIKKQLDERIKIHRKNEREVQNQWGEPDMGRDEGPPGGM